MKIVELIRNLNDAGYHLVRDSKHKIFSNGINSIAVPRHKEVNRMVAQKIMKQINR